MTVAPTEARIERAEIGGVPVFWADVPGPQHVSLVFRCGRADETLATAGLTHLVEHLALFALGKDQRRWGGFVDHVRTAFFMSGSLSELAEFVTGVSQALNALPLERLEVEKRILLAEAASAGHSAVQRLMRLRFGAKGFGLVEYQELGLHRADADEVANWSRERFAAENAAIWLSGRPPATLDLQLPSGRRLAPPAPAAIRGVHLPAYVAAGGGEGVLISFVATRSTALTVALSLLEQRLYQSLRQRRGLSYDACATYLPLTRDLAHLTLGADCLDQHAVSVRDQMLEELSRRADDGPGSAELTAVTDSRLARWSDHPSVLFAELDMAVSNELMSAPDLSREELQEELRELTPDAVAQAVREIRPTALLFAPTGESPPTGFGPYATGATPPLPGRRYRRRGRRVGNLPKRSRIIASSEGITYLRDAPGRPFTVHFH